MQVRSPSGTSSPGTGSVDLPTGRLSPVSAASSISRVAARVIRPSAGTRLPASTSTTSPGTSCSGVDLDRLPVAAYAGDGLHHLRQRGDALLGLRLLAQPDDRVEQGQAGQHQRRADVAGHDEVHDRGHQQDDLHEVLVLPQERLQRGLLLRRGQLVGPVRLRACEPPRRRSSPCAGSTPSPSATAEASSPAGEAGRTSICVMDPTCQKRPRSESPEGGEPARA